MRYLTDFADQAVMLPVVLAIAIVLAVQGWRRGAVIWLGVVAATFSIMVVLKLLCLGCPPMFNPTDLHSPSGHVAAATIVAGGLATLLTRRRAGILSIALFFAIVIGLSRLALGLHSLPEVVLGGLVGLAGAAALLALAGLPPPTVSPGRVLAVTVVVATLFHGLHFPAEAAIRHTALRTVRLLAICQPEHPQAAGTVTQVRQGV